MRYANENQEMISGGKQGVWMSDQGDGTYINPILYTDYSDPDAIRVGDDYFMVASSFCNAPGLPVLHSKDLINWKVISYALQRIPGEQYDRPLHGKGVWAPAIRYHDGDFIIFFPMPDEGIFVVKTKNPWGTWDEPTCLFAGKGWIDPCPFWDEDGRAYMVSAFAKSRIGFKSVLHLCEITPDCLQMKDEGMHIFDGNVTNQETIEGPKMYKRNGYYYIFAPAGGVKQGWQVVLRSKNIWGPYEYKEVLEQGDTMINGPHQGAWVQTQTGEDWFLHFQDVYAAGRIVHLQPMTWENDWPVIGDEGKPVVCHQKPDVIKQYPVVTPEASDDFSKETLGLQWQWNANDQSGWFALTKKQLVLYALPKVDESISNAPNLLLQKWHMPEFFCRARISLAGLQNADMAGMINLGTDYGAIFMRRVENRYEICFLQGRQTFSNETASAIDDIRVIREIKPYEWTSGQKEVFLGIEVKKQESTALNADGRFTFPIPREKVIFSYSFDGDCFTKVGEIEAKAGRWVGAKTGLFCMNEEGISQGYLTVYEYTFLK